MVEGTELIELVHCDAKVIKTMHPKELKNSTASGDPCNFFQVLKYFKKSYQTFYFLSYEFFEATSFTPITCNLIHCTDQGKIHGIYMV